MLYHIKPVVLAVAGLFLSCLSASGQNFSAPEILTGRYEMRDVTVTTRIFYRAENAVSDSPIRVTEEIEPEELTYVTAIELLPDTRTIVELSNGRILRGFFQARRAVGNGLPSRTAVIIEIRTGFSDRFLLFFDSAAMSIVHDSSLFRDTSGPAASVCIGVVRTTQADPVGEPAVFIEVAGVGGTSANVRDPQPEPEPLALPERRDFYFTPEANRAETARLEQQREQLEQFLATLEREGQNDPAVENLRRQIEDLDREIRRLNDNATSTGDPSAEPPSRAGHDQAGISWEGGGRVPLRDFAIPASAVPNDTTRPSRISTTVRFVVSADGTVALLRRPSTGYTMLDEAIEALFVGRVFRPVTGAPPARGEITFIVGSE